VTNPDSISEQPKSCAERWKELNDWLDFWFQPEKAETHDFNPGERELFDSLAPAWLEAEPGAGKNRGARCCGRSLRARAGSRSAREGLRR
jgi:hypothetical protein